MKWDEADPASIAAELGPEFAERFEVLGVLGHGGMGVVLRARQKDLNREVAIKLTLHSEAETRRRFQREGQLLARLRHPNLVAVLATGEARGNPYLVFELVRGHTMREQIDRHGPLPIGMALHLVKQIAEGLAAAHEQGILHRDVKCSNVMITPDGAAKLGDFGLALNLESRDRLTRTGIFMGTPEYTAPEVIKGEAPQPASDLYSLGMVAFEAIAGSTSFGNLPLQDLMKAHLSQEAPPLSTFRRDVPPWVEQLVGRLLSKQPARRLKSAAQVAQIIADGLEGRTDALIESARHRTLSVKNSIDSTALSGPAPARRGHQRTVVTASRPISKPSRKLPLAAAILLALTGVAVFLATRTVQVAVTDFKALAGQTEISATWRTQPPADSWLEVSREGAAPAVWRRGASPDRVTGLEPGVVYNARAACANGFSSLPVRARTEPFERPAFRVGEGPGGLLEWRTREPLHGLLRLGGRELPEKSSQPSREHSVPVEARDVLLGVTDAAYVFDGPDGRPIVAPLPPVASLTRDLVARLDVKALAGILGELYSRSIRPDQRAHVYSRARQLPVYSLYQQFRPLAADFFTRIPEIPDAHRLEVYGKLLELECLDAAARDYQLPLLVEFEKVMSPFVTRFAGKEALAPRFRWPTDFRFEEHHYWTSKGDSKMHRVIRKNMVMLGLPENDHRTFRFTVPQDDLARVRKAAVMMRVASLPKRSWVEVTLNGKLRLAFRTPEGWNMDVLQQDTPMGQLFPVRFLRAGENTLDVSIQDSPGVEPLTSIQVWSLELVGE